MPVTQAQADALAQEWIEAWNRHDIDAVLTHYSDDVIFTSPFAIEFAGKEDGTVHGKKELRAYWEKVRPASFWLLKDEERRESAYFLRERCCCLCDGCELGSWPDNLPLDQEIACSGQFVSTLLAGVYSIQVFIWSCKTVVALGT